MEGVNERFAETEEETVFEMELGDLSHIVVAPEQDPFSERPTEYLGQSAMERMMHIYKPPKSRKERRYRLILRMPSEKVSQDTAAQAKALISKIGARTIEDNKNRILQIQKRGRRQLPYALLILFVCIGLGVFFGLELFVEQNPIVALGISEGFYIIGWIALWRPIDVLLFDPMEIRMENKVLKALMEMQIEVVPI
ncbi:MAG: hypothetical protein LUQ39_04655 [Methanomassiliicoccales archaeon]|nr:hypothetical protein [Methanomassiliicoccales archaeon]